MRELRVRHNAEHKPVHLNFIHESLRLCNLQGIDGYQITYWTFEKEDLVLTFEKTNRGSIIKCEELQCLYSKCKSIKDWEFCSELLSLLVTQMALNATNFTDFDL